MKASALRFGMSARNRETVSCAPAQAVRMLRFVEWTRADYRLSDDQTRLDLDQVCALLNATYWAADWSRAFIEKAVQHSFCLGMYHHDRQMGFVRTVTDHVTFSWICDVVIDPAHRGQGLGTWMIQCLLEHPDLQTFTHALRTRDAHGLYTKLGFQPVEYLRRSRNPA